MKRDIREICVGRWPSILVNLGMDAKYVSKRHSDCPLCQGGKDRFRFIDTDGRGSYICSQCGAGDGLMLAMAFLGESFKETCRLIRQIIGQTKLEPIKAPDTEKNERRIKQIHSGLKRINSSNAAGKYLLKRGLSSIPEHNAYYHPAITYYDTEGKPSGQFECLVSIIRTPDNKVSTLQVRYLNDDGSVANVPIFKKTMPTRLPMTGGAIRLYDANDCLAIAEGVESAIAFYCDHRIPSWSVVNADGISKFYPPESIKKLYIIADEDKTYTGVKNAYSCANRLTIKGIDVCVVRLLDRKEYYDYGDSYDYNDYLNIKNHELRV